MCCILRGLEAGCNKPNKRSLRLQWLVRLQGLHLDRTKHLHPQLRLGRFSESRDRGNLSQRQTTDFHCPGALAPQIV